MNIAIIGTGYVGLVSGTCFADTGNNVTCVDIDEEKVKKLRNGIIPIYEPGLESLFNRNLREGRLQFVTDLGTAVRTAEIVFLCLPTPPGGNGQADLSAVMTVAQEIGTFIDKYTVIVNKSTVPVGTSTKVSESVAIAIGNENNYDIVSNPEFLREGSAVEDFLKPERIVIGTSSKRAANLMAKLYEPFSGPNNPLIIMDERSSELTKYAANAMLATKITFMNEISNICERVGANVDNIRKGIGADSRIGNKFLKAGIGYGGSCFPKDVQALKYTASEFNYDFKILDSVINVNDYQKLTIVKKIESYYDTNNFEGKIFGVWGLSFKPETDDVREAPALYIAEYLINKGAKLIAYDPEAIETFKKSTTKEVLENTTFVETKEDVLIGVDALIICTEWNEFRQLIVDDFVNKMKTAIIFDGRNIYDLNRVKASEITYFSVGRPTVNLNKLEEIKFN